jgi:hypothetical protein
MTISNRKWKGFQREQTRIMTEHFRGKFTLLVRHLRRHRAPLVISNKERIFNAVLEVVKDAPNPT